MLITCLPLHLYCKCLCSVRVEDRQVPFFHEVLGSILTHAVMDSLRNPLISTLSIADNPGSEIKQVTVSYQLLLLNNIFLNKFYVSNNNLMCLQVDVDVAHWQKNAAGLWHSHKHGFGVMNAWRLTTAASVTYS